MDSTGRNGKKFRRFDHCCHHTGFVEYFPETRSANIVVTDNNHYIRIVFTGNKYSDNIAGKRNNG
jgi:hypothetical protein